MVLCIHTAKHNGMYGFLEIGYYLDFEVEVGARSARPQKRVLIWGGSYLGFEVEVGLNILRRRICLGN